jgi:uncharacterized protein (TIGR00255 family)
MTGYGDAERDFHAGRLSVEIRTVNHRYLNVQMRLPNGLDRIQPAMEAALRIRFARGHVKVSLTVDTGDLEAEGTVPVDLERARGYRDALQRLQNELGVAGNIDVGMVAGFRDVFQPRDRDRSAVEIDPGLVEELILEAADRVVVMREKEGERLERDLSGRLRLMEEELDAIAERAPVRLTSERDRLRARIRELLDDDIPVDEERIAREVAHLADKWDIHEEIVRFRSHLEMFRETLQKGSVEGVGKRFGFIAQEILREANTLGSKANDAEISQRVVVLKEEVERLREQLENVE